MRLIDADALLARYDETHTGVPGAARRLIETAPTVTTTPAWISVHDRLPDVGQVVLAFGTRSSTSGMFQGADGRPDLWSWKGNMTKRVSHWMPLPEPPDNWKESQQDG